jgi:5'-3' exonuclease
MGGQGIQVHLVDGTYELFRHHFGAAAAARDPNYRPSSSESSGSPRAAARGVVASLLGLLEGGATHIGVATDHVIESFRNQLWAGYKTGAGVPEELLAQFGLVEEALAALGVTIWPMVELEADDALASAAAVVSEDATVETVFICTPDKDLGQCVVGRRVVQLDRRAGRVIDEEGVVAKFGVYPASIPDWLALVGDSADGFPGLPGWGAKSAAVVLAHYGHLEAVPDDVAAWDPVLRKAVRAAERLAANLRDARPAADLFKVLATLRVDRALLGGIEELEWKGPTAGFAPMAERLGAPGLGPRAERLAAARLA